MTLELILDHSISSDVVITSIALAGQYVLTMSDDRRISLYHLDQDSDKPMVSKMTSLYAQSTPNVSSLGLRLVNSTIHATICYAFYELSFGWCIGIQEIKVQTGRQAEDLKSESNLGGDQQLQSMEHQIDSRCASSAAIRSPFAMQPEINGVPTSLSYSHPYLLASLRDNTIMSYTVTSTEDKLEISSGRRLWGHTSAVSRAEVSPRGKAVSMSVKGQDIHVWELEEILRPTGQRSFHIPVVPSHKPLKGAAQEIKLGFDLHGLKKELAITRNWVGFDDEQVIVLGEQEDQRQIMTCYDFT
jgi:WD40 repeat protein